MSFDEIILWISFYLSGADGGLVLAVQQLSHVVHELRESTVTCFQSLNESITNLARKIPSPTPSPTQQPGTIANIHGDDLAQIPPILQFEEQNVEEADNNGVEEDVQEIETIYSTDADHVHSSQGYTTLSATN